MHDPTWFRQFEQEYNEREERLAEIRQKHKEFLEKEQKAANDAARSAWRKRMIEPGY